MPPPVIIQGELRVPSAFMEGRFMEAIEQDLRGYGLLPAQAAQRRWRMDADAPGGYVLTFTVVLTPEDVVP